MKNISLSNWFGRQKQGKNLQEIGPSIFFSNSTTVLIVDDSRTQLYAMEKMLTSVGLNVITAQDGKQGILMARQHQPDLIIMDIVMPKINGFQATRYLTRQPDTCHIPIIIISASNQGSDELWGIKLGAKEFLQKPVRKELLVTKIDHLLKNKPAQMPVAAQVQTLRRAV